MVLSFDPLERAADLLNTNFLDGKGRVTLPVTRDKRDELLEMRGGARTYAKTYGHFFRLKGRGVFPGN